MGSKLKKIAKIMAAVGIIGLLAGCTAKVSQDQYDQKSSEAKALADQLALLQDQLSSASLDAEGQQAQIDQLIASNSDLLVKNSELDQKAQELLAYEQSVASTSDLEERSYQFEEVGIGSSFSRVLTDNQLPLFDGEVTFDEEEYDAEEIISVSGDLVANKEDFGAKTFVEIPEGSVSYGILFEDALDTSEISDDEELTFSFLGEDITVSSWDGDEVTFSQGVEYPLTEGDNVQVEGKQVTLVAAGDGYVFVAVDGVSKKVNEGQTKEINGLDVKVGEVLESTSWRNGGATLTLGDEVELTVENGDEYVEDSPWEWEITSNYLGIRLAESYVDADADEEFRALSSGESLLSPNGYFSVKFDGLSQEAMFDYKFSPVTKEGLDYVKLKGSFVSGLNDYDLLYVNSSGFYDEDLDFVALSSVGLDDSELSLDLEGAGTTLEVGNMELALNFSSLAIDNMDFSSYDEDFLTSYGTVISSPEDSLEDEILRLSVPKEQITGQVSVIRG